MADYELDSFYLKFKGLLHAGWKATLTLEAVNGEAFVSLKAGLGFINGSSFSQSSDSDEEQHPSNKKKKRNRSYKRRQEKRKTNRIQGQESKHSVAEKVTMEDPEPISENMKASNVVKEEQSCSLTCDKCDFKTSWLNALQIHIERKHNVFDGAEKYWMTGKMSTVYQTYLDVCKDIENSNISEADQELEKSKALEARKMAFGSDFKYYPPWKKW